MKVIYNGTKHTVTCPKCMAKLHYNRGAISSLGYGKHVIECPCCREQIPVDKEEGYYDKQSPSIAVLEEGNFHKTTECNSCKSSLSYDYRDVKHEIISLDDYYTCSTRDYVVCPVCGRKVEVEKYVRKIDVEL